MIRARQITIRLPVNGEVPLSVDERRVALREGIQSVPNPAWHPAIVKNWSVMSARLHRKAVMQ